VWNVVAFGKVSDMPDAGIGPPRRFLLSWPPLWLFQQAALAACESNFWGVDHMRTTSRWGRRISLFAAAAAIAAVSFGQPASANAKRTQGFGPCYVSHGICLPRGSMTLVTQSVGRSGNRINYVNATFTYFGQIHNIWIDHDFYDANGNRVQHIQGPKKLGDFSVSGQAWGFKGGYYAAPRFGQHCATLFSQERNYVKTWKTVCNSIR
jgi:hypothetical protein